MVIVADIETIFMKEEIFMSFDHCCFQVSSIEKSIEFYMKKLNFELLFQSINEKLREKYAFLDCNGARLELIEDLDGNFTKQEITKHFCPHFCMDVNNMNDTIDALKKNGVEIIGGPNIVEGEETWLYIKDDDNNVIEFIQWLHK